MSLAIIAGTGLRFPVTDTQVHETPYGVVTVSWAEISGKHIPLILRHGETQNIAPHNVNYRANIWALADLGVQQILASAAVGGIHPQLAPGTLAVPEQIIDYTSGRAHTFFDQDTVQHIEFSQPYDAKLRGQLLVALDRLESEYFPTGVYGATQGPRLETAAEIHRLKQDGCDMVGMTGMPEAALAREKDIAYASVAVCANWAAGVAGTEIPLDSVMGYIAQGMQQVTTAFGHIVMAQDSK